MPSFHGTWLGSVNRETPSDLAESQGRKRGGKSHLCIPWCLSVTTLTTYQSKNQLVAIIKIQLCTTMHPCTSSLPVLLDTVTETESFLSKIEIGMVGERGMGAFMVHRAGKGTGDLETTGIFLCRFKPVSYGVCNAIPF